MKINKLHIQVNNKKHWFSCNSNAYLLPQASLGSSMMRHWRKRQTHYAHLIIGIFLAYLVFVFLFQFVAFATQKVETLDEYLDVFYELVNNNDTQGIKDFILENRELSEEAISEFRSLANEQTDEDIKKRALIITDFIEKVLLAQNPETTETQLTLGADANAGTTNSSECLVLYNRGKSAFQAADYETAISEFTSARECFIKQAGGKETANSTACLNEIGVVYDDKGDNDSALEYYNQALNIDLNIHGEEHADTATDYNNIGYAYLAKGDYNTALESLNRALKISLKVYGEEHPLSATAYNNIGTVYLEKGDYNVALENFNLALKISLKNYRLNHLLVAKCYNNIGLVHYRTGDHDNALLYFNRARRVNLDFLGEEHPETAKNYNNMGLVYFGKENYDFALDNYNLALKILLKVFGDEHPSAAFCYNNIGMVYEAKSDYDGALENFKIALKIFLKILGYEHSNTASCYNNIGVLYDKIGEYNEALENYGKALNSLCGGNANPIAANCRPESGTVNSFSFIGAAYIKTGKFMEATIAFENAANAIDRLRGEIKSDESKITHGENYYDLFPAGISAFVSLHDETGDVKDLERGFVFAERGIGRVFLEQLGRSRAQVDGGLPDDVIEEGLMLESRRKFALDNLDKELSKTKDEQSQSARVAAYSALNDAQAALDDYDARLLRDYPEYAALMNPQPRSLADIRDVVLAPGEAALEYYLGPEASWLIFVTKDKLKIVKLPPSDEIETMVDNLRRQLTKSGESRTLRTQAANLYDALIAPIEDDLTDIDKLLIVPTGNLYFLPFETLIMGFSQGEGYLVEGYDIRYAPSLNVAYMTALRHGADRDANWLGFGDPVYEKDCDDRAPRGVDVNEDTAMAMQTYTRGLGDDEERGGWCRIPGTGVEVRAIESLFESGGAAPDVFLDQDATEGNFKAQAPAGRRFVHVASHGTLGTSGAGDSRQPALVLSLFGNEESGDDGFLTMTEVFNMKTPADMIVLSACETGRGQMEKGEGVAGMSRAFLYAGADSLVVSLWSVADEQTKDLMVNFYTKILAGKDRQTALTDTKREFIEKGLAPYYWAPFIYIGVN